MKNILTIENGIAILLSNVDDGTNTIFINGAEIPASSWVGSGVYQYTESGVTFTIQKTNANTGNIMLQLVQGTAYRLVKQFEGEPYNSGDPLDTDLVDEDYMPFYDASTGRRKNSLWSNIVGKIKAAITNLYWHINGGMTIIPASSSNTVDLNTYTTPGNYTCNTTVNSQYITNQPLTSGQKAFDLIVVKTINGINRKQILYYFSDNNIWTRYTVNGGSSWSSWSNWNENTNTTYTFATGDSNGQIKVTPSGGAAQNVSVKGLGTAAYTDSTAYAVSKTLTNEDLDNVTTPGFYNAGGGNTCTNTGLASGTAFGLEVIHSAAGRYYMQRLNVSGNSYIKKRICINGTWGAWTNEVLNNLTSDSTTEALSAAQGKALSEAKVNRAGDTMTGPLTITRADKASTCLHLNNKDGTTSTTGISQIVLGNGTASGNNQNSRGLISMFSDGTSYTSIWATKNVDGTNQVLYFPGDKSGGTIFTTLGGTLIGKLIIRRNSSTDQAEFDSQMGTTSAEGVSQIVLGNNKAAGTAGNSRGSLALYSGKTHHMSLRAQDTTTARTLYLPASGTALATSATSSYRVKENIRDMTEEEAGKILDVNVVKFDCKEEYDDGGIDQSGVIAEEVLDIIPEVVNISKLYDETKAIDPASNPSPTVDYGKFTPYLIKMVQMQQERIDRLESVIEELRR